VKIDTEQHAVIKRKIESMETILFKNQQKIKIESKHTKKASKTQGIMHEVSSFLFNELNIDTKKVT
jgi:hypothetical protein